MQVLVYTVFCVVGLIDFVTVTYQGGQYGKTRTRSGASPTSNRFARKRKGRSRSGRGTQGEWPVDLRWRRQYRVDSAQEPGLTTTEVNELNAARRSIKHLEAELAIHELATELLKGTTNPKAGGRPSQ